jgi:hypothetical protein
MSKTVPTPEIPAGWHVGGYRPPEPPAEPEDLSFEQYFEVQQLLYRRDQLRRDLDDADEADRRIHRQLLGLDPQPVKVGRPQESTDGHAGNTVVLRDGPTYGRRLVTARPDPARRKSDLRADLARVEGELERLAYVFADQRTPPCDKPAFWIVGRAAEGVPVAHLVHGDASEGMEAVRYALSRHGDRICGERSLHQYGYANPHLAAGVAELVELHGRDFTIWPAREKRAEPAPKYSPSQPGRVPDHYPDGF